MSAVLSPTDFCRRLQGHGLRLPSPSQQVPLGVLIHELLQAQEVGSLGPGVLECLPEPITAWLLPFRLAWQLSSCLTLSRPNGQALSGRRCKTCRHSVQAGVAVVRQSMLQLELPIRQQYIL